MKKKNIWMIATGAVAALAGGLLFIKKKREPKTEGDKPPKDAPQLNIQNPGTQDDFPKAASESEVG